VSIKELTFIGTCFAVSPVIIVTTAHTYVSRSDIVENFGVAAGVHHRELGVAPINDVVARSDSRRGTRAKRPRDVEQRCVGAVQVCEDGASVISLSAHTAGRKARSAEVLLLSRAAYLQASSSFDMLILWLDRPLPYSLPLRGYYPSLNAPIITAWYHCSFTEHPLMTTSGVVAAVSSAYCSASGCVTDKGSSGAPVLCAKSGRLLGMHLGSNVDEGGVRHTEFIPARTLVELIVAAGVQTRLQHYSVVS
jgi:hypothetical protein